MFFPIIAFFLVPVFLSSPAICAEPFYTIQISSNRHLGSASSEADKLKEKGYNAFYRYESIEGGQGNWYKVYIGQYGSRQEAEEAVMQLKETLRVTEKSIRQITDPNITIATAKEDESVPGDAKTYTLHVSSFRAENRAVTEVDRLKNLGLEAYFKKISVSGVDWYRVYLGHFKDKASAKDKGFAFKQAQIISFYTPTPETDQSTGPARKTEPVAEATRSKMTRDEKKETAETSMPEIIVVDKETDNLPSPAPEPEPPVIENTPVQATEMINSSAEPELYIHPYPEDQEDTVITFKNLLVDLLSTHDMIKYSEENISSADAGLKANKSARYPSLDISSDAGHQKLTYEDAGYTDEWRSSSTVRAKQLITDFGKTTNRIKKSKTMLDKARYEYEATRQKILIDGITAYLNVIRARENLKYFKKSEENIKTQTGIEEALVEKGAGLSSDVLQAKSQLANAQAMVAEAEGQMEITKNRFLAIFKKPLTNDIIENLENPPLRLVPRPIETVIEVAMDKNPYIAIAEAETNLYKSEVKVQKSSYFPRLNLFAEDTYSNNQDGFEGYKNETLVGIELSYNLFNGGGDKAGIEAAIHELAASGNLLSETRHLIEEQARNAWQNLSTLRTRTSLLETQSTIAAEFLVLARKERKLGNRTLLDILNGEITYINAVSSAISSKIDTKIAAYNLMYVTGELGIDVL